MNYHRWLNENDPDGMLGLVYPASSQRKLRLWLAACLRRVIEHSGSPLAARHLIAVGLMERHADGQASDVLLAASRASMPENVPLLNALRAGQAPLVRRQTLQEVTVELGRAVYPEVRVSGQEAMAHDLWRSMVREMHGWMCGYLRDLYADPFDAVGVAPSWRTVDVVAVARGIYDERAWGRMPVLADALLDAGCDDGRALGHCREPLHARGCWLLDGVLGWREGGERHP